MATSTSTVNLEQIKKDLKSWEKRFRIEHGREITKEDVRNHPDIAAKYKLYKELGSNKAGQSSTAKKLPPVKSTTLPPSTPRPKKKVQPKKPDATGSIFQKSIPIESEKPERSSNPFSPVKTRTTTVVATSPNPFIVSHKPISNDDDNPFAPSSSSSRRISSSSTLFGSPTKSARKTVPPLTEAIVQSSKSSAAYDFAASPKKLHALIASASAGLRDTPRTKARKRLRGEDVLATPGDKRRKVNAEDQRHTMETFDDEDDDEVLGPSPVKPSAPGKAFRPLFQDDAQPEPEPQRLFTKSAGLPLFASATSEIPTQLPSARKGPIAGFTIPTTNDPFPVPQDNTEYIPNATSTSKSNVRQATSSKKRAHADTANDASTSNPQQASLLKTHPTMLNSFGLRPPSPAPKESRSYKGKGKGKWAERKKAKMDDEGDAGQADEGDAGDEQDEEANVQELDWRDWTNSTKQGSQALNDDLEADSIWVDPATKYRKKQQEQPELDVPEVEEETVEVNLPDDMRRILVIDSPQKPKRAISEEGIVRGLLNGEVIAPIEKTGEVWGVGEAEGLDEENDWESEPEGWTGHVEM